MFYPPLSHTQDMRKVGVAGVEAVEAVYEGLADAARVLLAHGHSATTRVVDHKYGPGAAQVRGVLWGGVCGGWVCVGWMGGSGGRRVAKGGARTPEWGRSGAVRLKGRAVREGKGRAARHKRGFQCA